MKSFDFKDLFIFEIANNHQGDLNHGLSIIEAMGKIAQEHGIRAAMKFQMRDLPDFVHVSHREGSSNKHVSRFLSTRLTEQDFTKMLQATRDAGLITMCTPFDEASVHAMVDLGIEVAKIGSPSASDWPLIEQIAESGLPVVASTGGLVIKEVDDLASFFDHRKVQHALMHCVSIYPTPNEKLDLGQIAVYKVRYPDTLIGYSGHEDPNDFTPTRIATALGASLFERHVGIPKDGAPLNAYSLDPEQVDRWVTAWEEARSTIGTITPLTTRDEVETKALQELRRGVYAKRGIAAGETITDEDVYLAFPAGAEQLTPDEWRSGAIARSDIKPHEELTNKIVQVPLTPGSQTIFTAIHTMKAMLNEAKIHLPLDFVFEISHHHGMENFDKVGTAIINCINREYCKKILVQLPGQEHPLHYHKRKEETFQVLSGELEVNIDDRRTTLRPGDTLVVLPGVWHSFWSETGCIFEEISTTHYNDDSYYADKAINRLERSERKTVVQHWGRYQIPRD